MYSYATASAREPRGDACCAPRISELYCARALPLGGLWALRSLEHCAAAHQSARLTILALLGMQAVAARALIHTEMIPVMLQHMGPRAATEQ